MSPVVTRMAAGHTAMACVQSPRARRLATQLAMSTAIECNASCDNCNGGRLLMSPIGVAHAQDSFAGGTAVPFQQQAKDKNQLPAHLA